MKAAEKGYNSLVKVLLEQGADVNLQGGDGYHEYKLS